MKRSRENARTRANRLNALKSTGPRTASGKARSSQNARWHGLRSVFFHDPGELRSLAMLIAGGRKDPDVINLALDVAAADLDVRLARCLRMQMLAFPALMPEDRKVVLREAARRENARDIGVALLATLPMTERRSDRIDRLFDEADAHYARILDKLDEPWIRIASYLQDDVRVLMGYEWRAFGRRRMALRKLNTFISEQNHRRST